MQSIHSEQFYPRFLGFVSLLLAVCFASSGCSSKPDGVDVRPITSLRLNAGPDFLNRIQAQLGGKAADWSRNGVGYLVYRLPNPDPDVPIFRNIDVYLEDNLKKRYVYDDFRSVQDVYVHMRQVFTTAGSGQNWKLSREQGTSEEKWFISYQGARFDTNHGMPVRWDTNPEIYIGVLKQNVFIEVTYTAYTSRSNYIQTINQDIRFAADLLSKAAL